MKEGWEYKKLKDIATFTRGLTYSKNDEAEISNNIVLRSNNVDLSTGKLNFYELKYLRPEFSIPEEKRVKKGSLLMCMSNGSKIHLGKVALINEDYPYAFGGFMALVTPNEELNPQFFHYSLSSPEYKDFIKQLSAGANINNIKVKELELFTIPVPPLSEQQRIVDYLDAAFAKIDAMKANAEKSLNEAKALFQASLKEMLEPKEGWEEKNLGDMCEIKSILVDPTDAQYKNLLHVGGANIVSETGELIELKTAAEEELTSGKFTFNDKDVLYNKIRPYLIKVTRPDFSGLCSADMYPLTSKKGMTRDYLYYILVSRDFTDYAIMNSARAGMPKLNRQALFAYKCMIPSLSEQQTIVEYLDTLKSKVARLQENYDKISQECDAMKQAILRQVFE